MNRVPGQAGAELPTVDAGCPTRGGARISVGEFCSHQAPVTLLASPGGTNGSGVGMVLLPCGLLGDGSVAGGTALADDLGRNPTSGGSVVAADRPCRLCSGSGRGTTRGSPHTGHTDRLPALSSGTRNDLEHLAHENEIILGWGLGRKTGSHRGSVTRRPRSQSARIAAATRRGPTVPLPRSR